MAKDLRMRFLLLWCRADGSYAYFERLSCKRLSTAMRQARQLWQNDDYCGYYRDSLLRQGVTHLRIHASEDGYHWEKAVLVSVPVEELEA